jgi:hypothetical protein
MTASLALTSPLDYQVIQRRSLREGLIPVAGCCEPSCERVEVMLSGRTMDGSLHAGGVWLTANFDRATGGFHLDLSTPVGGWYAVQVRAFMGGGIVAKAKVAHVGVGEVFVGAGQSNSTNCGGAGSTNRLDGRTKTLTRRVSTFNGSQWRIADDPQPGVHDVHECGSFWPAFGDAMATKYGVPIGVAVTGHSGTSIRQWTKKDPLFQWTLTRLRQLGPDGFRALLWHQGENDADMGMGMNDYADGLAEIISDFRSGLGRDFPFFVAQATFIPWPKDAVSPEVRAAQRLLWERGIALEGPDTDTMIGDLRDCGGKGIHFSKKGLKVHGEAWGEKVGLWLDEIMRDEKRGPGLAHSQSFEH